MQERLQKRLVKVRGTGLTVLKGTMTIAVNSFSLVRTNDDILEGGSCVEVKNCVLPI